MLSNIRNQIKNVGTVNEGKSPDKKCKTIILTLVLLLIIPDPAAAWPQESQWNVVMKNGLPLADPLGDANDGKDVVGNATFPCCYIFNNGSALFFRMRVDSDPRHGSGLKPYGWGIEIDSNANLGDYEWLILIDGILDPETVTIERNTVQGMIGDPSDMPEYINKTYIPTIGGYVNVSNAGKNFGVLDDYFISWYVPYADFQSVTGLDNFSAIRVFFGTSSSTHALVPNGADLVNGSDLFSAGSDWSTPMGTALTNGSINFVDASYNNIVNSAIPGDPVYIRVIDPDRNTDDLSYQTLDVRLISSNGDILNITLIESGISSGTFTGWVQTIEEAPDIFDGILQVISSGIINATYYDTNDRGQNVLINSIIDILEIINDPPVITMNGTSQVVVELGSIYVDAGATALDDIDGDITDWIITVNSVDNTTVGNYTVTYDVTDSSGNPAVQVVRTVDVVDTTPPVWAPVPSDRITGYGSDLNYDVDAVDPSTPITYGVNDTTNFTIDANGLITNNNPLNIGVYFLKISAADAYGNTAYSVIKITVKQYSKIYTFDADFDEGTMVGLEYGTVHDQLQLTEGVTTFPIMWIANAGEDTVSKWDTDNNVELARYHTWFGPPASHNAWSGPSPSRTAVDSEGNAYVANRHFDNKPADVIKILAFDYVDRNGNGVMDTSYDANGDGTITSDEMLQMTDVNGNGIIDESEIRDERIAWAVSVGPVNGLGRSLAIDNDNNIWLGLYNSKTYYKLSSVNGSILAGPIDVSPNTPYGALVDKNGILWGASLTTNMLKLDTRTNVKLNVYSHSAYGVNYGIALGYDAGDKTHVYLANPSGNTYIEFNSATGSFSTPAAIKFQSYGIATDPIGNIFASNLATGSVTKFAPGGSMIWSAPAQVTAEARGTVVDSKSNVWVIQRDANKMSKFNGSDGTALGVFNTGREPYTYSDATGLSVRSSIIQKGTWNVIHDSGFAGTAWGRILWNASVPPGGAIEVRVRSADTIIGLQAAAYQQVTNGNDFSTTGRYIEIETILKASPDERSPVLYDLTISQAGSSISGFAIDSNTKAGLSGVKISTNTGISAITGTSGSYSISVPAGSYSLTAVLDIRYYVNNTATVIVPLDADVIKDIELVEKPEGIITGSVTTG